jgi:hypothetical protein
MPPPATSGVAGDYVLDASNLLEFFTEQFLEEMPDVGDMGGMGGMDEAAKKEMLEQAKAQAKQMAEASKMTVSLKGDGTFTASGAMMGDEVSAGGTYEVKGDQITFTTTMEDGEEVEDGDVMTGTIKNGVIRFKPEEEMPFELVFRKK